MKPITNKILLSMLVGAASFQALANVTAVEYSSMPAVDCVINPYRVVDISSPVAGVIETLYVERSQQVTAGQVVVELEASVERANVELARYRAAVQSEIGLGQVNINFDQLRKKRVASLHQSQNISEETADQIEREVQLSKWKLRQARELLDIRKLELRRAEEQLRLKSIRAPFDGFVLDTFKYRGEYVEEQSILRLAQLDPLVIETIVPMEYFGTITAGMLAEIRPEVLLKEKFIGTVTVVDRIGDTASNTFGIKLSMPNPDNLIPAGLKCIVKFINTPAENIAPPTQAEVSPDPAAGQIERGGSPPVQPAPLAEESSSASGQKLELLASLGDEGMVAALPLEPADEYFQPIKGPDEEPSAASQADEPGLAKVTLKTPSSYMVMMGRKDDEAATDELLRRLNDAGVDDFLKYEFGINKGMISLGVFSTRAYAISRQKELDRLGFKTVTIERY